jgi:hypothetical protein
MSSPELALEDEPKLTTAQLEDLLRAKYDRVRYALFFDVPDAVSLDARRRIDAVAIGIWKSVGRNVSAFELKVSRSDWLRELKHVNKADPFVAICDYFWLVTGDPSVAKVDEIPACWGWMTATKHGLRVQRPAQKLPNDRDNMPWGFTVGLLRKLQDDLISSPDVRSAIEERTREQERMYRAQLERAGGIAARELRDLRDAVAEFEKASGITLKSYNAGAIGGIVKSLEELNWRGGLHAAPTMLRQHAAAMTELLAKIENAAAEMEATHQEQA